MKPLPRLRRRILPAFLAVLAVLAAAGAGPLPFRLVDPDGEWRISATDLTVAGDVRLEAILTQRGNPDRYVAVRFSGPPGARAAPGAFAEYLGTLFGPATGAPPPGADEQHFGFRGHRAEFGFASHGQNYSGTLFAFQADATWAVIYLHPAGAAAPRLPPLERVQPAPAVPGGAVALEPFKIRENPVTGFPISLEFRPNPANGHVDHILVTDVPAGSATERAGVAVGDEVVAIDGRKAQDFLPGVTKNSELGRIFLNREGGDEVQLDVLPAKSTQVRKVTLTLARPGRPGDRP